MNDFETVNMNKLEKAVYYLREYGWEYTKNRALKKLGIPVPEETEYMNWLRKKTPGKKELAAQRVKSFPRMPVIDVIIDETPGLSAGSSERSFSLPGDSTYLLDSLKKQSYASIGEIQSGKEGEKQEEMLAGLSGELVLFARADTVLSPDYCYELVAAVNEKPEAFVFYTDEDLSSDEKHRFRPYFKPDIAPELLLCFQYIGGVFAVRRTLLEETLRKEPGIVVFGNGWYDLIGALTFELLQREPEIKAPDDIGEVHPRSIRHIEKPLFSNLVEKEFEGFFRLLSENQLEFARKHFRRLGRSGEVLPSEVRGFFHAKYILPEKKPLVSILIPTKDHFEDLEKCIQSLLNRNTYPEFEIIIAENNSEQPETFAYYDALVGQTYRQDCPIEGTLTDAAKRPHRAAIVTWKDGFNYSGINNFAASHARGELLLLLNNDTELKDEDALSELVASVLLPGVGGAGAMLYYDDGTIQHGGVVYKIGGFAANALWSLTDRDEAYYPYSVTAREMSCCTAACLLLRREAFEAAGGFDEALAVALNDVDLCLKVRRAGYKILFNPYARLFHYESKSRGSEEESPEKQERFNREIAYFQKKWQEEIDRGDPYYNVNQTLHYANYSIELAEDNRGRYRA